MGDDAGRDRTGAGRRVTLARDRELLLRALAAREDVDDWTVRSTATVSARRAWRGAGTSADNAGEARSADRAGEARSADRAGEARSAGERAGLWAELHRDQGTGRGSATLVLAADADATRAVADAIARADLAIGPGWQTPSPAAPAKVALADPAIDPAALDAAVDGVARALEAAIAPAAIVDAEVEVAVDDVALATRRGQQASWRATRIAVRATVRHAGATVAFAREARRADELGLAEAARAAIAEAESAAAAPPPPGAHAVALRAAALLHGGRGLLEAIVAQADPALERQGHVRYRPGEPIAPGATLTLHSDGTLPFGRWSAPLGDRGEPVRRFPLVTRGVASGLGLDAPAAVARRAQPNGGVRGLVVPPGDFAIDALLAPGTLVVDALAWLEVERSTGWFRAEIASGAVAGGARVRGGLLRGDAIALLGRARRSVEVAATPAYRGPALWHLGMMVVA